LKRIGIGIEWNRVLEGRIYEDLAQTEGTVLAAPGSNDGYGAFRDAGIRSGREPTPGRVGQQLWLSYADQG